MPRGLPGAREIAVAVAGARGRMRTRSAMTTVTTCSNPAEAMLLKSLLEANDIPAFVPDELTAQSAPHFSGSGLHLQVADEHAETAKRILNEAQNELGDEDEKGDGAEAR
jgi:hypothetical protein